MNQNQQLYEKKTKKRKLAAFSELISINLGWGASLAIGLILLLSAAGNGFAMNGTLLFALIYLVSAAIIFAVAAMMKKEILSENQLSKRVRSLGYICILMLATGNIFAAIGGFQLIRKYRPIEYTMAYFAFIANAVIILLSTINMFKQYVANLFSVGMILLFVFLVFYAFAMVMIQKHGETSYRRLKLTAVISLVCAASGNIFALLLGLIILTKIRNEGSHKTVGWIDVVSRMFRNYMAAMGVLIVGVLLMLALCSYFTFDYAYAIDNDYSAIVLQPSMEYPFGTDAYGRCVYTRIAFGSRISLIIGMISTAIPIVIGGVLGAVAGYYSERTDNVVMRALDVLYAVPSTLLTIAIVAAFGASTMNLIIALSISNIPVYARTMRAQVMVVGNSEFVEAARACGRRKHEILFQHIIPNSLAPMIVRASLSIGVAVLSTSSLSYLGLGVEPHIPEWGSILKGGSQYLETNPYLAIFPGLAIILVVLAFNFIGDGLRDALDPKLK